MLILEKLNEFFKHSTDFFEEFLLNSNGPISARRAGTIWASIQRPTEADRCNLVGAQGLHPLTPLPMSDTLVITWWT